MLHAIVAWPTLVIALVVFGFAPGAVLRVIVLAFHRDDPRREELKAELYAVPRIERPFWVLEQLEVALVEGAWDRTVWAATGRIFHRWQLESGLERHRANPVSFWIPSDAEKRAIQPGVSVKLIFTMKDGWGERMWVDIVAVTERHIVGTLRNQPCGILRLCWGDVIRFTPDHVIDIDLSDDALLDESTTP
jgi:hypothetical protein